MARNVTEEIVSTDTADERVKITVDADDGTFTVTFGAQTTGALAFDVAAEDLESALEGLSSIPDGAVSVTGGPGVIGGATPYFINFQEELAATNVGAVTTNDASLVDGAETAAVVVLTSGSAGHISSVHQTTVITDPEDENAVSDLESGPDNVLAKHQAETPIEQNP